MNSVPSASRKRKTPKPAEVGIASDTGLVRNINEDSLLKLELVNGEERGGFLFGLYAVADGIGGHEAGEIASALALRVLSKNLIESLVLPSLEVDQPVLDQQSVLQRLSEAVKGANSAIYDLGQAQGNDMGTTLAAVLILKESPVFSQECSARRAAS